MKERAYYDLHLKPSSLSEAIKMLYSASYMGFKGVGLELTSLTNELENDTFEKLKETSEKLNLNLYFMIKTPIKKERTIKNLDPLKTIIFQVAENEKEFRRHLKNPEIQVITINPSSILDIVNPSNLNLLKQTNKALEILLKQLWLSDHIELQRLIKNIYKVVWLLNKKNKIYVSSGAEHYAEMRNPRVIRSLLRIIGVKDERTLYMLSELPNRIIWETKPVISLKETEEKE